MRGAAEDMSAVALEGTMDPIRLLLCEEALGGSCCLVGDDIMVSVIKKT